MIAKVVLLPESIVFLDWIFSLMLLNGLYGHTVCSHRPSIDYESPVLSDRDQTRIVMGGVFVMLCVTVTVASSYPSPIIWGTLIYMLIGIFVPDNFPARDSLFTKAADRLRSLKPRTVTA